MSLTLSAGEAVPSVHRPGFRLQRLEVANFGPFQHATQVFLLEGENGMLTGDEASGPVALLQGLTELLVPSDGATLPVGLGRCVILAVFRDVAADASISLARAFWRRCAGATMECLYACAERELSIDEHFRSAGSERSVLAEHLIGLGIDVPETARRYMAWCRRRFDLADAQAWRAFRAFAAMPPLGGLNELMRRHVLAPIDVASHVIELSSAFSELEHIHRDHAQASGLEVALTTLLAECEQYRNRRRDAERRNQCRNVLPDYFARMKLGLLDKRLACMLAIRDQLSLQIERLQNRLRDSRSQVRALQLDLVRHGGDRLERLSAQIRDWVGTRDMRRAKAERYAELVRRVGEEPPADEAEFHAQRSRLKTLHAAARDQDTYLERALPAHGERLRNVQEELEALSRDTAMGLTDGSLAAGSRLDALQIRLHQLEVRVAAIMTLIGKEEAQRRLTAERLEVLAKLEEFAHYDELDWMRAAEEIDACTQERDRLEASADALQTLNQHMRRFEEEVVRTEHELEIANERRAKIEQRMHDAQTLQERTGTLLAQAGPGAGDEQALLDEAMAGFVLQALGDRQPDLETIDAAEAEMRGWLEHTQREEAAALQRLHDAILQTMEHLRADFPRQSAGLALRVDETREYAALLQSVRAEVLPGLRAKLDRAVQIDMSDEFALLQAVLARAQRDIPARIARINAALSRLGGVPEEAITLAAHPSADAVLDAYRAELAACAQRTNPSSAEPERVAAKFQRMRAIVERLRNAAHSEDERRWFMHVMDVRQWFVYSAACGTGEAGARDLSHDEAVALTVLAADLALRFQLTAEPPGKFRFVALGAAVACGSLTSLTSLLGRLRHLDVQMLVLTPRDAVRALELHVQRVGFVCRAGDETATLRNIRLA